MNATAPKTCPQCGQPIAAGLQGLCQDCLALVGFGALIPAATASGDASDSLERATLETGSGAPLAKAGTPNRTVRLTSPTEKPGDTIGRYKLLQKIGEGGCGTVYMAEQSEPVRRKVALKVIKLGMDTKSVIARFEAERQALAMMDHPNIAKVLDAGATDAGRPYFVMELVRGIPITKYCDENHLDTPARLDLFTAVCSAIQHAHQKGIIHRDIKPSNILVTLHDGVPVPKVIDFGIAKATEARLTDLTLFTELHAFVGTPAYMSPEQAEMSGLDMDTRADIYSLGVLLYELLSGKLPFDPETLLKAGLDEMRRTIREVEPPRPSTRLMDLVAADVRRLQSTPPPTTRAEEETRASSRRLLQRQEELATRLRGDLDWIVMKALEKDRTRRYESASAFAQDIKRYLGNEAVLACPPSAAYLFRKLVRRHRLAFAAGAAIAASLVIGLSVSTWLFFKEKDAREKAVEAETKTQQALGRANVSEANAKVAAASSDREWHRAEESLYVAHMGLAKNQYDNGRLVGYRELLERHRPEPGRPDLRGWEWAYLNSLLHREIQALGKGNAAVLNVDWHPEGEMIAGSGADGVVRVWQAHTGQVLQEWSGHTGSVHQAEWNPSGTLLASAGHDGSVRQWKPGSGQQVLAYREAQGPVRAVAWSADGRLIISGGDDGKVRLWEAASGKTLSEWNQLAPVTALAVHPSERLVACGKSASSSRNELFLLAFENDQLTRTYSAQLPDPVVGMAWSPDGATLAGAIGESRGYVFTLAKRTRELKYLVRHRGAPTGVDWSADGKLLASSSGDQTAQSWNVAQNLRTRMITGHVGAVNAVKWSPDDRLLATAGADGFIKICPATGEHFPSVSREFRGWATGIAWSPDSRRVAVAAGSGEPSLQLMDPANLDTVQALHTKESFLWDVAWSPDGQRVAGLGGGKGTATIWHAATGKSLGTASVGWVGSCIRWSPDSQRVLVVRLPDWQTYDERCTISILDGNTAKLLNTFSAPKINRACWSRDGSEIITCGSDGIIGRWDWQLGKFKAPLFDVGEPLVNVQGSPDGKHLAASSRHGRLVVLDEQGAVQWNVAAQAGVLEGLCWSPDGTRIAAVASDGSLKIRNAQSGEEVFQLQAHEAYAFCVAWSPDGRRIATGGYDKKLRIWDSNPGRSELSQAALTPSPNRETLQLVLRPGAAQPAQIDLSSHYNGSFKAGWLPSNQWGRREDKNLPKLEPGLVTLGGVVFDVRGVVQAGSTELPPATGFPRRVKDIGIHAKAGNLHFLQACAWDVKPGALIGRYQVHYVDGTEAVIPLEYGLNTRDWNSLRQDSKVLPQAREVWREVNAYNVWNPEACSRLYVFPWKNPKPEVEIKSIDLVSEMTRAAPFLMAITVE